MLLKIECEREVLDSHGDEVVLILTREISFKSVHCFMKAPFPGNSLFEFGGELSEFRLGELTEFTQSEWAQNSLSAWHSKSSHTPPALRHFSIQFMSENLDFHILAEGVYLLDECSSDYSL